MNRHGARALLVVSCLLAAAAIFQSFQFNQSHQGNRVRLLNVERDTSGLLVTLGELRAAQMAYLATGQGPDFWMARVTTLAGQLRDGVSQQRAALTSEAAQSNLDAATAAIGSLMELDGRARSALQYDQRFLASDLIFTDGVTAATKVSEPLGAARRAERVAIETALARDRVVELALFPAALLLVLVSAWLDGSSRRRPAAARSEAEELAQMLRDLPPPVKAPGVSTVTAAPVATPPSRAVPAAPPAPPAPAEPVAPRISLPDMAELCVDLARVIDARDMPSLLQRAARSLEATGVIVWVVDTAGERLTPALAHGYSDRVLAKLGTLDVAADNVTSLSFRSKRPQSMPGAGTVGSSSAIAVPLVTNDGCSGVFAAEVPGSKPGDDCIAVARILAAQLATMLAPVEPAPARAAEA